MSAPERLEKMKVLKLKESWTAEKQVKKVFAASGMLHTDRDETGKRSRDADKQAAKRAGAKTANDYAYHTGIYSPNAYRVITATARDLLTFCIDTKRARTMDQITAEHIKDFMMLKLDTKKTTFDVYCAHLTKIDAALCRVKNQEPQWREMIKDLRKNAALVLDNQKPVRAYRDPEAIISRLEGDKKLVAELQYRSGLRIAEATGTFFKDKQTDPTDPMSAYRGIQKADLVGLRGQHGLLKVVGKGGRHRVVKVPVDLYRQLEQKLEEGPFRLNRDTYRYALREAVNDSGQIYHEHGTHGLRWNYAQERLDGLVADGTPAHEAMLVVSNELGHSRASITALYQRRA